MYFVRIPPESKGASVVAITDVNTFCLCPDCGDVVQVNLDDYIKKEGFSLSDSSVMCPRCTEVKKFMDMLMRPLMPETYTKNAEEEMKDEH